MKYEVGKPHILACWIYGSNTHFKVHYWSKVSMLEDGPSDCEWIIPGTINV